MPLPMRKGILLSRKSLIGVNYIMATRVGWQSVRWMIIVEQKTLKMSVTVFEMPFDSPFNLN